MILGERGASESSNWSQSMQGEVAEVLLTMEGVQVIAHPFHTSIYNYAFPALVSLCGQDSLHHFQYKVF